MDVNYNKFKDFQAKLESLSGIIPAQLGELIIDENVELETEVFNGVNKEEIYQLSNEIRRLGFDDLKNEVVDEIAENIANITSDDQVKRYLNYLNNSLVDLYQITTSYLNYHDASKIYSVKLIYNETKAGRADPHEADYFRLKAPGQHLKAYYFGVVETVEDLLDHVEALKQPDTLTSKLDIEADSVCYGDVDHPVPGQIDHRVS